MRPEAQAWWNFAEEDLESARVTFAAGRYYIGAFLSQQCVEKGFKAVWIAIREEMPPKTHNLLDLAEGLGVLTQFETPLLRLNPLYVTTRYPDAANGVPARNYNKEITRQILDDAEQVMAWCREQIGKS